MKYNKLNIFFIIRWFKTWYTLYPEKRLTFI